MNRLLIIIISVFVLGCGSKYVNVEVRNFNVKVKQLYKQDGVIVIYYLMDEYKGHKITSAEHEISVSEESSLYDPILTITEKASYDELRGTSEVLEMKYELVLPTGYKIKEKE